MKNRCEICSGLEDDGFGIKNEELWRARDTRYLLEISQWSHEQIQLAICETCVRRLINFVKKLQQGTEEQRQLVESIMEELDS